VLLEAAYGSDGAGAPITPATAFQIASISKSFTAAAVATLVDEGRMEWDEPLRRHLPQVEFSDPYRTANVTIRDLLAHRVGVEQGNFVFRFTGYDTAEVLRRMRFLKEREPFRTTMLYSNVGYTAAGEAAANAAGVPFAELIRTRLLEPLGMTGATAGVPHSASPNHASPHAVIGGVQQPIAHTKMMSILPANAVNANAIDVAKWMLFQLGDGSWNGKRIVSQDSMAEMHSPQVIIPTTPGMRAARGVELFAAYGLGWNIMDYRGHKLLWHSGSADGMPVYTALLPADRIGVTVMVNTWGAPTLHGALASHIFDVLLGLDKTRDWSAEALAATKRGAARDAEERAAAEKARKAAARPSLPLAAYAGVYTAVRQHERDAARRRADAAVRARRDRRPHAVAIRHVQGHVARPRLRRLRYLRQLRARSAGNAAPARHAALARYGGSGAAAVSGF
jgi:CubicO group peptidase (beta-lactamase class C family)